MAMAKEMKCIRCKKEIKEGEGHYKTPEGNFCVKCYEKYIKLKK